MPTPIKQEPTVQQPSFSTMMAAAEGIATASNSNLNNNNEAWIGVKQEVQSNTALDTNQPPQENANAPTNTIVNDNVSNDITNSNHDGNNNNWKCDNCQIIITNKKRCGKCHRWKGGKRDFNLNKNNNNSSSNRKGKSSKSTKKSTVKHQSIIKEGYPYDTTQDWTCNKCNVVLPGRQTRCGKCNGWRGGKRQGGWKIKTGRSGSGKDDDDVVMEDQIMKEWTCCEVTLPARQKRCGNCNGWRGGKRVFSVVSMRSKSGKSGGKDDGDVVMEDQIMKEWTCCEVTLPAKQKRCGKCNGWRGGKRQGGWKLKAKSDGDAMATTEMVKVKVEDDQADDMVFDYPFYDAQPQQQPQPQQQQQYSQLYHYHFMPSVAAMTAYHLPTRATTPVREADGVITHSVQI